MGADPIVIGQAIATARHGQVCDGNARIADWIKKTTDGAMDLGPGTLYRTLK
jgi:hypothetical protein